MSTKNNKRYALKLALITAIGKSNDLPIIETVNLILAMNGTSLSKISRDLGVSRQLPYQVLKNPKKSKRIREAISNALGFNFP